MRNSVSFSCEKCGKKCKEDINLKGFENTDGENVQIEHKPYCEKCGNKMLRAQKNLYKIYGKMQSGEITEDDIKNWQSKEMSNKEFFTKVNHSKGSFKQRKLQMIENLKHKNEVKN